MKRARNNFAASARPISSRVLVEVAISKAKKSILKWSEVRPTVEIKYSEL